MSSWIGWWERCRLQQWALPSPERLGSGTQVEVLSVCEAEEFALTHTAEEAHDEHGREPADDHADGDVAGEVAADPEAGE